MPTWTEIQRYARSKYPLAKDEERWFSIVFGYGDTQPLTQRVVVRHFSAFEQEWIEFRSAVCRRSKMTALVALQKNHDLAVGALCIHQGRYALTYSVPLATLDPEEFELPLHVIARTADDRGQEYSGKDEHGSDPRR
jgi:hypothetical protein